MFIHSKLPPTDSPIGRIRLDIQNPLRNPHVAYMSEGLVIIPMTSSTTLYISERNLLPSRLSAHPQKGVKRELARNLICVLTFQLSSTQETFKGLPSISCQLSVGCPEGV